MRLSPLFVGLLGFAVGCADGAGSSALDQETQAIVGPSQVDAHDRAVVLVEIETPDGETGFCSGVVVAPRAVLTAAHCVATQAVGAGATFSLFLGTDPTTRAPRDRVDVTNATADPEFDLTLLQAGHDVAILATRTPFAVVPIPFEPSPPLDEVTTVRVVGFGVTDSNEPSVGPRREAPITLARFDDRFLELGLDESAPCLGDSGGPAFAQLPDGTEALAGVISFTNPRCGPFARVTRLAPYESFLRSAIAESESPRVSDITARGGCAMRGGSGTEAPSLAASALVTLCERARRRRRAARSAPPEPEPRFTKE